MFYNSVLSVFMNDVRFIGITLILGFKITFNIFNSWNLRITTESIVKNDIPINLQLIKHYFETCHFLNSKFVFLGIVLKHLR